MKQSCQFLNHCHLRTALQGLPLPPPGAGLADAAAAPGSPGAVGASWGADSGGGGGRGSGSSGNGGQKAKKTPQKELLGGVWRLVYSSGFAGSRSTGGRRPGVPLKLLPADFGQVRVSCSCRRPLL